eukprot:gene4603-5208_t
MPRDDPVYDAELVAVCEKLWDLDKNRLTPDVDYKLDLQGKTRFSYDGPDRAEDPLFEFVDANVLKKDTFKAFIALLDNYENETGLPEVVTKQEQQENWRFINLVFDADVMKEAYKFLKSKKLVNPDIDEFKRDFYKLWFYLYRSTRGERAQDSSGFEHVFVGETRGDKQVIGFHNWIQFYLQEKLGNVDYKGFISGAKSNNLLNKVTEPNLLRFQELSLASPVDRNPHLVTIQFTWKGETKPIGSSLIGVSPEFEIALYTTVFLMGYESANITLGGEDVIIKCHKLAGKIRTCYPVMPR